MTAPKPITGQWSRSISCPGPCFALIPEARVAVTPPRSCGPTTAGRGLGPCGRSEPDRNPGGRQQPWFWILCCAQALVSSYRRGWPGLHPEPPAGPACEDEQHPCGVLGEAAGSCLNPDSAAWAEGAGRPRDVPASSAVRARSFQNQPLLASSLQLQHWQRRQRTQHV